MAAPPSFQGTERFQVKRCLGAGGFGTVYEAFDRKRNAVIALKVLRQASADDLYRFKQEFRSLSGMTHRNLVTLYELRSEENQWFFSMEFVQGTDFITHHRSSHPKGDATAAFSSSDNISPYSKTMASADGLPLFDTGKMVDDADSRQRGNPSAAQAPLSPLLIERLLRSLRQLTEGLLFLHDQGLIHRDIKPANVLCTSLDRVVLLDFGLVQEFVPGAGSGEPAHAEVAGTPDYMSPEQASGQKATVASDWYSVGVLLYQALTGRLPFSGTLGQVLRQKISHEVPPLLPSERSAVPEALQTLCMRLLCRQPELRPTGREILACLHELDTELGPHPWSAQSSPAEQGRRGGRRWGEGLFIGRQQHLQTLGDAFDARQQGKSVVALCRGESGAGKSALCRRFLKELVSRVPEVVVLSGRCFAHEDVPFKAVDGVIDSLGRFLSTCPHAELTALLPRDISAVGRLFPVLLQVAAIREAPPRRTADDLQAKQVAFAALRELVFRLSEQRPVVLFIDDLQWGDPDGISLLLELLRPPNQPRLLLLVAYRLEEEPSSAALLLLRNGLGGELGQSASIVELQVDSLSEQEGEALAAMLLPSELRQRAATIASESGGSPYFITELSRSFADGSREEPSADPVAVHGLTLDGLIRARVERLPEAPRKLLAAVAVAGQPISRAATALAIYGDAIETDEPQALALLRSECLIRFRHAQAGPQSPGPREELLTYHDRIREVILAGLLPSDVKGQHLRLAQALVSCGHVEPEQMLFHLQNGGDLDGAARYAVQTAAQAYNALAYHQAVRLCRTALATGKLTAAEELLIKARLADSLVGAGHPKEAGELYMELAGREPPDKAFNRRRQAAKQFFISGHIKEGMQVLESLLPLAGLKIPKTSFGLLGSLVYYQLLIAVRGMEFHERTEAEVSSADLLRMDTCEAIASSAGVNPLLAANFWTQLLWYALRAGEPRRIVQALTAATGLLFGFGASRSRVQQLQDRALAIAERRQDSYGIGRCIFIRGQCAQLEGRWRESLADVRRAIAILKGECVDSTALIDFSGSVEIINLGWLGDLHQLAETIQPYLKDAVERGRKSQELTVRLSAGFLLLLGEDTPERAEEFVKAAQRRLEPSMIMTHFFGLHAQLMVLLYQGRAKEAWQVLGQERSQIERAGILRMDVFQSIWRSLCALVILAAEQPLQLAVTEARRLSGRRCAFAQPMSKLITSLVRRRQGRLAES
ncbi:MAG TPA: protein kinase, partial [Pseudomonadota bacterium]|nr:protein kinase [Pseudomonadota bacterium]